MKSSWKFLCICALFIFPFLSHAATGLAGIDAYNATNGVPVPINDLQITGPSASTTPVKLLVTSGTLQMSVTTGLTFDGATSGSVLYFSGTLANLNAALSTLTYTRSGTGSDTLEVSLVNKGEVFFSGSNHLYQYIAYTGTWGQAQTNATTKTLYGATGYLATITSQSENEFVSDRLTDAGWMGASDVTSEGDWKWVTGPESGTSFWSGASGGSTVSGRYANWGTGEPNDASNEDCAQFLTGGSGKWNDLPCSVTTLPGYVVEFGAPGNMPVVTAKNITVTTTNFPSINIFSPTDDATGASTTANLTLTFSENISTSTGNIVIRKVSDNTIFETINVASSTISKNNNIVTINPVNNFEDSTAYYVTIPNTAFRNVGNAFYQGTSASTTWNFTTGDFTAPIITNVASTTGSTTATLAWTTNELSSSRVYFGATTAYGTSSLLADISPRVLSHSVSLSNLPACTTFNFTVVSTDASSNSATSSNNSFVTSGCVGVTPPVSATSSSVTSSVGGTSTLATSNNTITVTTPPNFTATSSTVEIQIQALEGNEVHEALGKPNVVMNKVGVVVFDVKAIINGTTILDSFDAPVTITYTYTDEDIVGLDESSLWLYHFHNNAWSRLDSCSINAGTNTITCTTPSFSIFSLFGQTQASPASFVGPRFGGTQFGCKDTSALNYNQFSSHKQDLCEYKTIAKAEAKTTTSGSKLFTRDLSIGATHAEVALLQKFLNEKGYTVATKGAGSKGNETTKFGGATKAALVKYQKSMKITPAVGYFGKVTRATVE